MNTTRRPSLRQAAGLGLVVASLVAGLSACGSDDSNADTAQDPTATEVVAESTPVAEETVAPAEQPVMTEAPAADQPEDESDHADIPNESYVDDGSMDDQADDPAAGGDQAAGGSVVSLPVGVPTTVKIPTIISTTTINTSGLANLKVTLSDFAIEKSSPLEVTFKITEGAADIDRIEYAWTATGLTGRGEARRVSNQSPFVSTWAVGSMLATTSVLRLTVFDVNGNATSFVHNF